MERLVQKRYGKCTDKGEGVTPRTKWRSQIRNYSGEPRKMGKTSEEEDEASIGK